MARPFQAASALSSRAGCGRAWRAARSRARALGEACDDVGRRDRVTRSERHVVAHPAQDRSAFPVARFGHVVGVGEERGLLGTEDRPDLVGGPDIGGALLAVGVGVLAGREGAARHGHLAQQVVERGLDDLAVARLSGDLPGVQVGARELGVVVEHLLEMRHEPDRIGRVAGEATAELVVDASRSHGVERPSRHRHRLEVAGAHETTEEVLDGHRRRELGRSTPAASGEVERLGQAGRRAVQHGGIHDGADDRRGDPEEWAPIRADEASDRSRRRTGQGRRADPRGRLDVRGRDASRLGHPRRLLPQRGGESGRGRLDLRPLVPPGGRDRCQHLAEGRHAVARLVREVGAADRTAGHPASGRRSSASRRSRSSPARRPCRWRRGPAAPRDRP